MKFCRGDKANLAYLKKNQSQSIFYLSVCICDDISVRHLTPLNEGRKEKYASLASS